MIADDRALDAFVVPLGGGGLLSGTAIVARSRRQRSRCVIGAEADASPVFTAALAAGRPVTVPVAETVADGLAGNMEPDSQTFDDRPRPRRQGRPRTGEADRSGHARSRSSRTTHCRRRRRRCRRRPARGQPAAGRAAASASSFPAATSTSIETDSSLTSSLRAGSRPCSAGCGKDDGAGPSLPRRCRPASASTNHPCARGDARTRSRRIPA